MSGSTGSSIMDYTLVLGYKMALFPVRRKSMAVPAYQDKIHALRFPGV